MFGRLSVVLGAMACSIVLGADMASDVVCEAVTMVRYYAGPEWERFKDQVAGHLAFARRERLRGVLLYNGPAIDGTGGYLIWRGRDLEAVAAALDTDPAVVNGTVTYSLEAWRMCGPSREQK
jgi:uncharacterized protein YciI